MRIWFGESPTFPFIFVSTLPQNNMEQTGPLRRWLPTRVSPDWVNRGPGSSGIFRGHRFDDFFGPWDLLPKHIKKVWENPLLKIFGWCLMVSKWEDYLQFMLKKLDVWCFEHWHLGDIIWRANQGSLDDRDLSWPFWSWWIELLSRGLWWESMIFFCRCLCILENHAGELGKIKWHHFQKTHICMPHPFPWWWWTALFYWKYCMSIPARKHTERLPLIKHKFEYISSHISQPSCGPRYSSAMDGTGAQLLGMQNVLHRLTGNASITLLAFGMAFLSDRWTMFVPWRICI